MANASAGSSGQVGGNASKKHPLIHDHLQQKFTDPNNAFSIDRTFSATSTDIQPSFDVFDDEEDEDDSNSSSGGGRNPKKKGKNTKSSYGGGGSSGASTSHSRAEAYRKDTAFHRLYRRYDNPDNFNKAAAKSKYGQNSYYSGGKTDRGNFNGNNITTRKDMKSGEIRDSRNNDGYYVEMDDSIGVPSDISGMLQDSEVMDDDDDEGNNKSGGVGGHPDLGLNNNNNGNSTTGFDNKDNGNTRDIDGCSNENRKSCVASSSGGDEGTSSGTGNGDDGSGYSSSSYKDASASTRRGVLRSSVISDGRFGSVNSVSSSFNSAAAAAINGKGSIGGGIHMSGGGGGMVGGNNDILNERLERFHRYTRGPYAPLDRCNSTSVSSAHSSTITQHYYPEGGWGYVVLAVAAICHALMCGLHLSAGVFILEILGRFKEDLVMSSVWLVSFSMGTSLFLSPIWVAICTRRSTRLTAVFGGLVTSLACLFTSFASQFHQTFISFGIILSIGIGLSRDASYLMVGQYFKRRRDFVEVFLVAASGLGILVMTLVVHYAVSGLGWRFGLQAMTGGIFGTFFLGTCYRSASLYHPQRRAILHLKNQKRKIKEKGRRNDRPPFLDYSCLSSRSIQLLILSTTFTSFGCYSPLFHLALECTKVVGMPIDKVIYLYVYIGAGWILGSCLFGVTVVQRNEDCRISKPYLLQGSTLIIAGALFALATFYADQGLGSFCWIYGFGLGSYNYVLKAWTYEKTRAKNFAKAWSFVQCAQGLGCILGVPATGYMNFYAGQRMGYFMSSASVLFSVLIMLCCGMRRRRLMRNKSGTSSMKTCETFDSSGMQSPVGRRISFSFPDEPISPRLQSKGSNRSTGSGGSFVGGVYNFMRNGGITPDRQSGGSGSFNSGGGGGSGSINNFALTYHHQQQPLLSQEQPQARTPKELTCISEEGALEPHGPV